MFLPFLFRHITRRRTRLQRLPAHTDGPPVWDWDTALTCRLTWHGGQNAHGMNPSLHPPPAPRTVATPAPRCWCCHTPFYDTSGFPAVSILRDASPHHLQLPAPFCACICCGSTPPLRFFSYACSMPAPFGPLHRYLMATLAHWLLAMFYCLVCCRTGGTLYPRLVDHATTCVMY